MAIEYKDVLRLEGVEATIEASTLRNKQVGFSTDGQHRMVRKNAAGTPYYWTADGYNVTYGDVTIGENLYHNGDLTTFLKFTTGAYELSAGGKTYIKTESGKLLLEEEVKVGEVTLPYTGGEIGSVLTISETGIATWGHSSKGTLTLNVTGFSDLSEITFFYNIQGNMACLYFTSFQGTSNQGYIRLTSFPYWLSGGNNCKTTAAPVANCWINGGAATLDGHVYGEFDTLSGTFDIVLFDGTNIGWDNTGTKGLYYGLAFYYWIT